MPFALLHKVTSYLLALAGFSALALSGELPIFATIATLVAMAASFFVEPTRVAFTQTRLWTNAWNVMSLAVFAATALAIVAIFVFRDPPFIIGALVATQLFLWAYNAPVNALIVNSVPPGMRARAVGLSILSIHLLGDAVSPLLIGVVSDVTGSLETAMVMVPVAAGVGALIWLWGWRTLPDVPLTASGPPAH